MRRNLILAAVVLILGGVVVDRVLTEDAPPAPKPAPSAKTPPAELPRQTIGLGNGVTFEMVLIPAGEFNMGSPETEEGHRKDEVLHRVRSTKPFWLATTEVTRAAWRAVMGSDPVYGTWAEGSPTLPATHVSWKSCHDFLKLLNIMVWGGGFRLPAEAEWEYACRAGSESTFCFGDDERELPEFAWFETNSTMAPHPVGLLRPNGWGLHDMHGNVGEWCEDVLWPYVLPAGGVATDPSGPPFQVVGYYPYRVVRGGSWSNPGDVLRSARRTGDDWFHAYDDLGFRVARTVTTDATPVQVPGAGPPALPPAPDPKPPSEPAPSAPPAPPAPKPPGEPARRGASATKDGEVPSWAKVAPEQIEAAREAGVPVAFENSIGMRFVLIPAGTFTMGSPVTEAGRWDEETPHPVTLTKPYYLGVTEVTNGQYRRFEPNHDSRSLARQIVNGEEQPVVDVSWEDAAAFAAWLGTQDRAHRYRLPTEAEWERACRAGRATAFWFGDDASKEGEYEWSGIKKTGRSSHPVGTLRPNAWGLYDMHGNVMEWCQDWMGEYPRGAVIDPSGLLGPDERAWRVIRGGNWGGGRQSRSAYRRGLDVGFRAISLGFRLAADVAAQAPPPQAPGNAPQAPGHPDASPTPGSPPATADLTWTAITSRAQLSREVEAAGRAGKATVVYVWADWCHYCGKYDRVLTTTPAVTAAFSRLVRLRLDVTQAETLWEGDVRAGLGIPPNLQPVMVFIDAKGRIRHELGLYGWLGARAEGELLRRAEAVGRDP